MAESSTGQRDTPRHCDQLDYERFHSPIPAELDRAMRAAGVLGWRIHRNWTTMAHIVEACDRMRMQEALRTDPVNLRWQEQIAAFLTSDQEAISADRTDAEPGALVWDMSWPTR